MCALYFLAVPYGTAENGHPGHRPRLIPDPTRKGSSFSPFSTMAAVGPVWIDAHYQVDEYSS